MIKFLNLAFHESKEGTAKGKIKSKSRLAHCRFSQKKRKDEFDLFAVKSTKANKTNSSVCFLGESMEHQSAFEIN